MNEKTKSCPVPILINFRDSEIGAVQIALDEKKKDLDGKNMPMILGRLFSKVPRPNTLRYCTQQPHSMKPFYRAKKEFPSNPNPLSSLTLNLLYL
jgi:hypothetical protein